MCIFINNQRYVNENNEITFFTYHNGIDKREQSPEQVRKAWTRSQTPLAVQIGTISSEGNLHEICLYENLKCAFHI